MCIGGDVNRGEDRLEEAVVGAGIVRQQGCWEGVDPWCDLDEYPIGYRFKIHFKCVINRSVSPFINGLGLVTYL